jgi:polyhydroxyalkanoate synthase
MAETGSFDGSEMANTFNMLRANDMIWSFVVNNYLLGKDPFPFDLLYWNADSTRLPARMHSFYLRNMYLHNNLVKPGRIVLNGVPIHVQLIDTPIYFLSTREDHIAPWKATYQGTQLIKGPVRFVLSASGHIAGVVNPPSKQKYCYWTSSQLTSDPEQWLRSATEHQGSWWMDWHQWALTYAGDKVPAVQPGSGAFKALEEAPGSYVKMR